MPLEFHPEQPAPGSRTMSGANLSISNEGPLSVSGQGISADGRETSTSATGAGGTEEVETKWNKKAKKYIDANMTSELKMSEVDEKIIQPLQEIADELGLKGEMKLFG